MIRGPKLVSLMLLAVFAMGGFAPTPARGVAIQSSEYPQTITGEGKGIGLHTKTEYGSIECEKTNHHGTLFEASSTITLSPTYTGCTAFFGFASATIHAEGCTFVLHAVSHDAPTGIYAASTDISCPSGQSIKWTIGTCRMETKAQTGLSVIDITNMSGSPSSLTMRPTVKGIAYTVTQDGFGCPFSGTGNKTGGEYTSSGYITITAPKGLSIVT
jgi:hypothetical protein